MYLLSTVIEPLCSSTSSLTRARPIPVPSYLRVEVASAWLNRSNILLMLPPGIPSPVSDMTIRQWSSSSMNESEIFPPLPVNFKEFESRFIKTLSIFSGSKKSIIESDEDDKSRAIFLDFPAIWKFTIYWVAKETISISCTLKVILPASIFEKSRRLFTRRSKLTVLRWRFLKNWASTSIP